MLDLAKDGYYIIRAAHSDISQAEFTPATKEPSLKTLQDAVGGYIQLLSAASEGFTWSEGGMFGGYWEPKGVEAQVFCNEDGMSLNLLVNPVATTWTRQFTPVGKDNVILGDVIILCGKAQST
jgi:hypothetical protein